MNKRVLKFMKEWGLIIGVLAILYLTGLHTEVAALAQRAILTTGIFQAETISPADQIEVTKDMTVLEMRTGEKIQLTDLSGKVVFINFWATWCAPCVAEMPGIDALYQDYAENDAIEFLIISVDKDANKVGPFMEKKGFKLPIYRMASQVPNEFNTGFIPRTFIISKEGKLISKHNGMADYDTKHFRKLLNRAIAN